MSKAKNTIRIFYSWQSDLSSQFTKGFFREAIQQAVTDKETVSPEITIIVDEATSNTAGSPEIPDTILDKLNRCDIFIGDLSIINNNQNEFRKTPNPNVLFETGYARAILGWSRIIMLFNSAYGDINDLPFDLNKRRITKINCSNKEKRKEQLGIIRKALFEGIGSIIQKGPIKPFVHSDNKSLLKVENDNKKVIEILSCLHLESIDTLFENLPDYVYSPAFDCWQNLKSVLKKSNFFVYDEMLETLIKDFMKSYDSIMELALSESFPARNPYVDFNKFIFHEDQSEKFYKRQRVIERKAKEMKTNLEKLLNHIRQNFHEISIETLQAKAKKHTRLNKNK